MAAGPAQAHGGPIKLTVSGNAAGDVDVLATYVNDNEPVEEPVTLLLEATDEAGNNFGPVPVLTAAGNVYRSLAPLPPGRWSVVVTALQPSPATAQAIVDVTVTPTPIPSGTGTYEPLPTAPALTQPSEAASGSPQSSQPGRPAWAWLLAVVGLLALAGAGVAGVRRYRGAQPRP